MLGTDAIWHSRTGVTRLAVPEHIDAVQGVPGIAFEGVGNAFLAFRAVLSEVIAFDVRTRIGLIDENA